MDTTQTPQEIRARLLDTPELIQISAMLATWCKERGEAAPPASRERQRWAERTMAASIFVETLREIEDIR